MVFGHLAVSALEHKYAKLAVVPVMAVAVFPDAVDKIAHYVLGKTESGRLWGHTLTVALLTSALCLVLFGKRNALSWLIGYLSHLICDIGSVVPWLYPFVVYEFPPPESFETTLWMSLARPRLLLELALSVWAVLALRRQIQTGIRRLWERLSRGWEKAHRQSLEP
ncbi:MAG: metal-dependent hydrolase [Anaerolineae bacterium]